MADWEMVRTWRCQHPFQSFSRERTHLCHSHYPWCPVSIAPGMDRPLTVIVRPTLGGVQGSSCGSHTKNTHQENQVDTAALSSGEFGYEPHQESKLSILSSRDHRRKLCGMDHAMGGKVSSGPQSRPGETAPIPSLQLCSQWTPISYRTGSCTVSEPFGCSWLQSLSRMIETIRALGGSQTGLSLQLGLAVTGQPQLGIDNPTQIAKLRASLLSTRVLCRDTPTVLLAGTCPTELRT